MKKRTLLVALAILAVGVAFAQRSRFGNPRNFQRSSDTPTWTNAPGFEKDVFTFVRIRYGSSYSGFGGFGGRRRGGGGWATDYPDADLNLAYRLQQMTSMKVDPQGKVLEIADPELFRHPFIYIVEPGNLSFTSDEVPILRRYLLHGGFLMVDDFWGEDEWENLADELKLVFPDREIVDIPRTHPLFHCVFDIPNDLNLQCPNIGLGTDSQYDGVTWERFDARDVHIRGIYDDKGRLCVVICHNTDNGDGWEREGENQYYFREFSEKKAYPLGINIIFYAMTH
jgi:hypothetical protein